MGLVYHYTSPEAMLSILQNKTLRFSDCEFMNDPEEVAYCFRIYDRAWVETCLEVGVPEDQIIHAVTSRANPYECESSASEDLGLSLVARYYSFSTCLDADNLAMWSCYACRDGKAGYALGFDSEVLARGLRNLVSLGVKSGVYFDSQSGEVCYSEEEQVKQIKSLVRNHLVECGALREHCPSPLDCAQMEEIARGEHWARMSALAPFIKRPGFAHEREYRFALRLSQFSSSNLEKFKEGQDAKMRRMWRLGSSGVPIPYYELPFGQALSDALKIILIMRSESSRIVANGMRRLLDDLGYQHVAVAETDVWLRKL